MKFNDENDLLEYVNKCIDDKSFQEALDVINANEDIITKKYYDITKNKLICLYALNKYIDCKMLINNELSLPYIPKDFEEFLHLVLKEVNFALKSTEAGKISVEELEKIDEFDNDKLLSILPCLQDFNLVKFVGKFQKIFNNKNIHPLTKTLLIASLSDYKLDHYFEIEKEGQLVRFNTSTIYDVRDSENYQYILNELETINDLEINSFELLEKLTFTYLLYLYPLVISEDYCKLIISSAIILTNQMLNISINSQKYGNITIKDKDKVDLICEKMNNLLEGL